MSTPGAVGSVGRGGRARRAARHDVVRRARAVLLLLVAALGLVVASAGGASAHATLRDSDPAPGAVLDVAPEQVTFTFDEAVIGVPAGIRVFDATGAEVPSSAEVEGSRLVVDLDGEVPDGTLVVLWRLVSSDGHPIGGSLSFAVGAPSAVVDVPAADEAPATEAPVLLGVVRGVGYAGLLAGVGVAAFVVLLLPPDAVADRARARLRVVARVAAGVGALGWVAAVPLVALYQLGLPPSAVGDPATWSALAPAELVVPAVVLVGLALAAGALPRSTPPGPARAAVVLAGCALAAAAPALTGHTRAASPQALAVAVDVLHVAAGATWFGGVLALALVLGDLARGDAGAVVVSRFSTLAAGVLAVLVVAGTVLAWRVAGSWDALATTSYGRLLLVKVAVVAVAVGVAAWNRLVLVPRLRGAAPGRDARTGRPPSDLLVRTTRVEAGLLVAVLLVTGFLVDRSPDPEASAAPTAAADGEEVRLDTITGEVTLTPLGVGPATVTITMTDDAGAPAEGYEAPRLALSSGDVDLGEVPVVSLGPGVYSGEVVVPTTGEWDVQVSLRTTEFDNPVRTVTFVVP
ncbi:copper transport protein [Isoptericola jiangsuensis]|uniref:Copper transport protein n=1 Tax=Isoptericola jiangsuensis TaxID=548579 RepID=A0A2A9F0R4_9MICO|nr:CopD family protein [Isoptericola jiangsuensis]PFG44748.1 copper transport protein [Isoptericola jiangsuensis]